MSGRKPLTLEELRKMEKPTPVWAETKKENHRKLGRVLVHLS